MTSPELIQWVIDRSSNTDWDKKSNEIQETIEGILTDKLKNPKYIKQRDKAIEVFRDNSSLRQPFVDKANKFYDDRMKSKFDDVKTSQSLSAIYSKNKDNGFDNGAVDRLFEKRLKTFDKERERVIRAETTRIRDEIDDARDVRELIRLSHELGDLADKDLITPSMQGKIGVMIGKKIRDIEEVKDS